MNDNVQQTNSYNNTKKYFLNLDQYFGKYSTLTVTLVDSEAKVNISISPSIDPQGVSNTSSTDKKYDYTRKKSVSLNIDEVNEIVSLYELGAYGTPGEGWSSFHKFQNTQTAINLTRGDNGYMLFSVKSNQDERAMQYAFSKKKSAGGTQYDSQFIQFINTLKGIITNYILIKSGFLPESTYKSNGNYSNNQGNGYQNNQQQTAQYQSNNNQQQNSFNQNNSFNSNNQQQTFQSNQRQSLNDMQQPQQNFNHNSAGIPDF